MTPIACPKCSKKLRAPPGSSGHDARCAGCGTVFAIPPLPASEPLELPEAEPTPSPLPPPLPPPLPGSATPSLGRDMLFGLDWPGMGPYGRAGLILAMVGGALAVLTTVIWTLTAAGFSPDHWSYYSDRRMWDAMPRSVLRDFLLMAAMERLATLGSFITFAGFIVTLLNANKETPPPNTRQPAIIAARWLLGAFVAVAYQHFLGYPHR